MRDQPPAQPEDTFAAYQAQLSHGHQALARGDGRAALEAYRRAVTLAGERALPHVMVGRALLALGRASEALRAFDDALARGADDPAALSGKAEALLQLGRRDAAAEVRARLDRPAGDAGDTLDGDSDPFAGRLPRAEAELVAAERAWQDGRPQAALDGWLAAARGHAAEGHLDAALDVCQRALLADGGAEQVHLEMCRLYLARGLRSQALERMQLLARLAALEGGAALRAELLELARAHAAADPAMAALADRLGEPPPG